VCKCTPEIETHFCGSPSCSSDTEKTVHEQTNWEEKYGQLMEDILRYIDTVEELEPAPTCGGMSNQDFSDGYHKAIYGLRLLIHSRGGTL